MNNSFLFLPKSLSGKIFLLLIVAMVCIVSVFNVVLINIQKKTYRASYDAYGATLIRLFVHSISFAVTVKEKNQMHDPVSGMLQQNDVLEVVVWDKDWKLFFQTTNDITGKFHINGKPRKIPVFLSQDDYSVHQRIKAEGNFTLWGQVFFNSSGLEGDWYFNEKDSQEELVGYAAIVLSKKKFDEGVHNILVHTGASVLIFLFVIILTIYLVIQNVTEPLRKLVLTIRKREGETKQPSDLTVLTETYASMVDDLERSFRTISELNEGLEDTVQQRTVQLIKANDELHQRQEKLKKSNADLVEALRQLKETQDQLIQKEKLAAIGQLVAGVAHELNNTVNFISGALPSLHRSLDEMKELLIGYEELEKVRGSNALDEKFDELSAIKEKIFYKELFSIVDQLMENIEEGTRRTTGIVRDLKIFSREDVEKMIPVDVHTVIDSTINYVDKQAMNNITICRDYGSLPMLHCLPGRLGQVFLNIMNNGIQAMDGAGQLTIKTTHSNEHVHIIFSDTGCGIHPNDVAKIFDPFFTSKEVGKGTGLGLGISYTIIRQHGGDIKVQSKVGKGSSFKIILPINPLETSQEIAQKA